MSSEGKRISISIMAQSACMQPGTGIYLHAEAMMTTSHMHTYRNWYCVYLAVLVPVSGMYTGILPGSVYHHNQVPGTGKKIMPVH